MDFYNQVFYEEITRRCSYNIVENTAVAQADLSKGVNSSGLAGEGARFEVAAHVFLNVISWFSLVKGS